MSRVQANFFFCVLLQIFFTGISKRLYLRRVDQGFQDIAGWRSGRFGFQICFFWLRLLLGRQGGFRECKGIQKGKWGVQGMFTGYKVISVFLFLVGRLSFSWLGGCRYLIRGYYFTLVICYYSVLYCFEVFREEGLMIQDWVLEIYQLGRFYYRKDLC